MNLQVIREDETITHIALDGRLDIGGVQAIELKFLAHTASRGKPSLIDMKGVEYISSLGIRMILSAAQALKRKGARCLLFSLQPLVKETLELAGLDEILASADNEEEAIRALLKEPGL